MAGKTFLKTTLTISVFFVVLAFAGTAQAKIIYVDDDVTGVKDGSSWANAYKYLQDALADAYSGDEIRVAQGIYKPDRGTGITHRDRDATFQLKNGVAIKGGYAGLGEPDTDARDINLYETTLSGDLTGNDDGNFMGNTENSYHVVTGSDTDETALLDGFTITGGNAENGDGGGMYNYDGRPTLINCTFSDNSAGNKGGGVYSHDTYEMTLINCRFSGNSAGEDGGGMACWYNYSNSPTLTNCIFSGNSAGNKGGGMSFVESEPVLSNCSFSGNSAGNKGGGIYMNFWYGYPVLTNCILWGNSDFAGMAESAQINTDSYGPPVINYICVQGWTGVLGGIGNIGADPCFVEPGYWDANGVWVEGDYHLLADSPCIDAGDPNYVAEPNETDLDGKPRVIRGRIDMGAYEFQGPWYWYVDDNATGNNDGSSWADAFNFLQDALAAAWSGDEIRVAQGTYKPDQGAGITPGNREATFQLINGVTLKGGYAGFGETDPDSRNIELYETILTGDLNGNDGPNFANNGENSYHVVTGSGTDANTVLDGFTIAAGNANGPHDPYRFELGGGMYCNAYSSPTVINCTFIGNYAGGGGGLYIYWDNNMMLTNCAFIGNYAGNGGGMEAMRSRANLTNCVFSGNAARKGGGMRNQDGGPTLTNCTFSANSAAGSGGGIDNFMSSLTLTNCTLTGNSAEYGGAINSFLECTTVVTNSILWANTAAQGSEICLKDDPHYSSDASISYCNLEGGITGVYVGEGWRLNWGQGNIDSDPLFQDPDGNDNIPGTEDDNLRLSAASPCIDAGDPNYVAEPNETDLDGKPRVIGRRVDMGAYEYQPRIIYVDDDATGANDGSSWADAYKYLQDALATAYSGDEIWVAQGIYKPDQGEGITPGDRTATFQLKNGVTLKGGYAGFGETDPDSRNIELYETILTGDLNGNDVEVADPRDLLGHPSLSENSYHVVTGSGTNDTAVLDGFTISGGNANEYYPFARVVGGGMWNYLGSPIVTNCVFKDNAARVYGGGMYNEQSSPTLFNCNFRCNAAEGSGSGMCNRESSNPTLTNCTFSFNVGLSYHDSFGVGMYNYESNPTVNNCAFTGNSGSLGAGMYNYDSNPILKSCTFTGNMVHEGGGGMRNLGSSPTLINCTFSGNWSDWYGVGGMENCHNSTPTLTNCILWNDMPGEISGPAVVTYSNVQGSWPGAGNIDTEPYFVSPGYWDTNDTPDKHWDDFWVEGDYHLLLSSPCIDAGDPNYVPEPNETDLDGKPRVIGGRIDMGAYEYQPRILYVDDDATGANNGSSWGDAYNYLQDALTAAWSGDEVRVAQGIYKPDQGAENTPGDREATFQLINGVTLKGGYAGFGEPDPNARDIKCYETILSGDLDGNDVDVNDPEDLQDEPSRAENSYHVVTASGTDETAVLDGFTIAGGNADHVPHSPIWDFNKIRGGGVYNEDGSALFSNCTFVGNFAGDGGGIYNKGGDLLLVNCTFAGNSARPVFDPVWGWSGNGSGGGMSNRGGNAVLTDCTFSGNFASSGGGMDNSGGGPTLTNCTFSGNSAVGGGGMSNGSSPEVTQTLINCTFSGNSASTGGGMSHCSGNPTLVNCTFIGNSAVYGGGMFYYESIYGKPTLIGCTFSGNTASDEGGGMLNWDANPTLTNCTFSGNSAREGGVMFNYSSNPTLINCILWSNSDSEIVGLAVVTYSDVKGGWPGDGNIDADPFFVSPGCWDPNSTPEDPNDDFWVEGDYHLLPDSPCIDAGDPNYVPEPNETDLDGKPRVMGGRIDMGAYESPVFAQARIVPQTINLSSKGNWINCYIWLPEEYNVADIEPNSIFLDDEIHPEQFSVDEQQQLAAAKFTREDVQPILNAGDIKLTITGQLTDGTVFEGTDVIRVIDKGGKK